MKRALTAFSTLALFLPAGHALADTYEIDPVHSHALFKILHLNTGYQYGRFKDMQGTVIVDEANPAKSSVKVTLKTNSVDTNNKKRDQHLMSPDFFDARQFPVLTFVSTAVKKTGVNTYQVAGNLTLHGKTKPVSFVFKKTGEGKNMQGKTILGGEAIFDINRMDFGINYMPKGLSNKVTLMLAFEGAKQ